MEKKKCLNIGCGSDYRVSTDTEEWINIDRLQTNKADLHIDLEGAILPYADNSIDHVYANMIFEHIHNYIDLMLEIHRVLKPRGTLFACVPVFPCEASVTDPEHCRFFTESSFHMFCDPSVHEYFKGAGKFKVANLKVEIPVIAGRTQADCEKFLKKLTVILEKVEWIKQDGRWIIDVNK